ncbi:LLM class F420-dependent oxidoreductase [Micromonospora noduli]|uniref:LLM class F420-dependent oxidoreductase n=1 Tax=Micromonospora noduli TaxID=709876 RepID=UPI00341A0A26
MKLGLHYWNYSTPADPAAIAPTLAQTATVVEQAGVASFTVMDHFFQMDAVFAAEEPMLEAYTTLGYVAAMTQRMTLGVLVTGVMYRYPGLLAKTVTTLDVLSGGRARLGIGASWYEREQLGLGVPVVPVAERFERLEETLRICLQMWSADDGPFNGQHYQLAETINSPQPLSRPHPPIMIGGGGEKKTLLLVARYADACNLFGRGGIDDVARKLDVLRGHCAAEGPRLRHHREDGGRLAGAAGRHRRVSRRGGRVRRARSERGAGDTGSAPGRVRAAARRRGAAPVGRHRLISSRLVRVPHDRRQVRPSPGGGLLRRPQL